MNMDVGGLTGGLFHWLLRAVYPPRCVLCGSEGINDRDICATCYRSLPWIGRACEQCAIPLPDYRDGPLKCGRCLHSPPAFDSSLSLFSYKDEAVRLIHRLKFNQKLAYSRLLGGLLVDAVGGQGRPLPGCIVPVPLHPRRLRQRGFNQSIELARPAARAFDLGIDIDSIARVRDTPTQTGLDRNQRGKNIRGAFEVARPPCVRHIALIDDVVTTASTVNELARMLKKAGAERVDVWSIARAG
jgi:ComF family protein